MKKVLLTECVIALLVLLFVYAGSSKLLDMKTFRAGMMVQPFATWMNKLMAAALPFAELLIAIALGFGKTRRPALYAYALLMLCFTAYTGLVVFHFFAHTPCGCGGIINHLSWQGHFIINTIFLLLSCLAIVQNRRQQNFMHKQGVSPKPATE